MTARIDLSEGVRGSCVRVAGRLDEPAGFELLELCRHRTGVLLVDLAELVSADRAGIDILKDLRDAGARIVGASPYIQILLNGGVSPDEGHAASHGDEEEESE